jgi:hypothetical protein
MNRIRYITVCSFIPKAVSVFVLFLVALTWSSCQKKIHFLPSSQVPGARGFVTVRTDKANNYSFKIKLSKLEEASVVRIPRVNYIVWMESHQQAIKKMGKLSTYIHYVSKNLNASFETLTELKPVRIFITAETAPVTQNRETSVILTTESFKIP